MQLAATVAFLLVAGATGAAFRGGFAGSMQPDIAARSFAALEDKWAFEAKQLLLCRENNATDCEDTEAFQRSCGVVAKAVIQGSSGDKRAVAEYMGTVCGQAALQGWKGEDCGSFAQSVDASMSADQYFNREELNVTSLCGTFWQKLVAHEGKRMEVEKAARAAEAAEEARRAAEEAKATAEKRAKEAEEEKKAQAEAARAKAEEAKKKAEEQREQADEAMRAVELEKQEATKAAEEARAAVGDAPVHNATGLPLNNTTEATGLAAAKVANTTSDQTATKMNVTGGVASTSGTNATNTTK